MSNKEIEILDCESRAASLAVSIGPCVVRIYFSSCEQRTKKRFMTPLLDVRKRKSEAGSKPSLSYVNPPPLEIRLSEMERRLVCIEHCCYRYIFECN